MRKRLFSLISSALLLTGCAAAAEKPVNDVTVNENIIQEIRDRGQLRVGCKTDVPGLSLYQPETGEWSGIETDIAYQIAAVLFEVSPEDAVANRLVDFRSVTVADRETMLENQEIDCMLATYTITSERQQKYALSDSYYTSYIGMMVRDFPEDADSLGSQEIHSVADLDGKYIGVPRNATTRGDFLSYLEMTGSIQVTPIFCEYESYNILYNALKNGNIDVMAVDTVILEGYDDDDTRILNDRFAAQHYGAAVLKENTPLIPLINQAISLSVS
ncbi:MAG: transporter substrate-binding domain-containing protein [Oscillospiraceae bacterium]|nr:transporter substrate-binding domain-containing protein [Oscillospiraceae bacterium]